MSNEFSGKTAIISGGAGGIGFALAEEFGQLGMKIVIADIDQKELVEAEQKLREANIQVLACPLDVTSYQQWEETVAAAEAAFGDIHMLINNAGVGGIPGSVDKTKIETWKYTSHCSFDETSWPRWLDHQRCFNGWHERSTFFWCLCCLKGSSGFHVRKLGC
jgi:NAD(P)-dependent dehydrogenase (short-subunit alcohol dehydrogenase family)